LRLAARRAEGQRDVEIAIALLALKDTLLRFDDAGDEFDVVLPDVHLVKERQKIAPLFEFPAREAGGADARQRAPRKVPPEMRGKGVVERQLGIAAGKALVDKFVLRRDRKSVV